MKQVVQSYKTGEVALREVPVPQCGSKRILVRNQNSLISLGTERSTIELGRKSLLGKAAARPDLVRRAWDKAKKEGLLKTWQEAMGRLDTPTPLGYSSAGIVELCGVAATEFSPGDRVACIGQGFASHAEFVSVPVNLACRIPKEVSNEEAAFGMLGIIALHGVRSANLTFGSNVVVMGLGLLGLLTIQILKSYGCSVIAIDPAKDKTDLALRLGFLAVTNNADELVTLSNHASGGLGVDAVIITAATRDHAPVDQAIHLCRPKGRIVVVGTADIHPDRNELWQKEVDIVVSKAGGPGSVDPLYEIEGVDLPIGDVRWTQKRNLQEFLRLIAEEKIDLQSLITHRVNIEEAETVYAEFIAGTLLQPIGVLLAYPKATSIQRSFPITQKYVGKNNSGSNIALGVIGAGLFGKALLLPALKSQAGVTLHTLATGSGASVDHSARKFGFANQTTDPVSIWENPEIDAVIGLTPHSTHAQLVSKAITYGKALFLEKPVCVTPDELAQLREQTQSIRELPIIFVGHNRRYSPHTKRMSLWLSSRQAPLVIQMRINSGFVPASHWVHSEEEGRSRVVGEMSHFIDLIQCLVNAPIVRVFAERISSNNFSTVNNDNISINFKLEDGSVGSMIYSASGDKAYSRERTEIFFDGKTIVSNDFRHSELHQGGKAESFKTSGQEMGYEEELQAFLACSLGKVVPELSLQQLFATMDVIFAIEQSLASGQPVYPATINVLPT
ncbi:bi-domain-containing oxidoreductase [Alcaligenaceae bacterium LF4-65]|uniref:Bi-domain-containing oxidoreductase n=1 Tax=Zwartia hollandica TaxID=324606 RepID=A0A953T4S6_9BURK|nr:bi-domain-containing oxidoreductase [Zwartia hollandica]MBZ1350152.1 bi-domain-containing oxidoreductase [Zwartia hollandica]